MNATPRPAPRDVVARREAIETLDRPVLVEAGAGTGKTTLLVDHVLHALAVGAARMPGVVAITFTEKAAAELRLRLRQALEAGLERDDVHGDERVRWTHALLEFDRARVSTIHAFAAQLLRARPVEAGIDSQFRVLDELESSHFFHEFWTQWVDAHIDDAATAADLRVALLAGVRLEPDLERLARELDVQRDLVAGRSVPPGRDFAAVMQAFAAAVATAAAHAERHCRDDADKGRLGLRALEARVRSWSRLAPDSRPGIFLEDLALDVSGGRAERWVAGQCATSKAMRRQLRDDWTALRQSASDTMLHGVLNWLSRFAVDYAREKRRRAVLDFHDLLVDARCLLHDHPEARRTLAADIDLLCVDEFQDTDPLQAEIVWFLSERGAPASDWQDVEVGPKLFLVGDPKQSIYRFRRADLDVYTRCAARVEACGGRRLDIVHNFRSRPAVLDWVNGTFATLFDGGGPRHVPLSGDADTALTPAVWLVQPEYAGTTVETQRRDEAAALVAWIARALHERWPVRRRRGGGERPLEPRDVALLFARTAGIEVYEAALRAAGLPFQQEGGRLFFERQEVRDVLQALAAIDDPHDELAVAACLRSPLFAASDGDLFLHRMRYGGFAYLDAAPDSPLALQLQILAALHAERHDAGIAATIATLLDRTGARAFHATQPQAAQALANLEMLQRQARQFEIARGAGLREFVRALHDVRRDTPRVAEWAPQDEDENRIRVLTVHMAKGLEFGCVVLANVGARANAQTSAVLVDRDRGGLELRFKAGDADAEIATSGYEAAAHSERERDHAEDRRLLYVAATRARDYWVIPEPAPDAAGFARWLRLAPVALQGGAPLGEFVVAGSGVPAARACVVAAADLPPVQARRVAAARADLGAATRARAAWARVHDQVLACGGAVVAAATPAPPAALEPQWPWRQAVLQVLAASDPATPLTATATRVAVAAGEPGRAAELAALAATAQAFEARLPRGNPRRGVQMTAAAGGEWIEVWLDFVHQDASGVHLVQWTLDESPASTHDLPRVVAALAGTAMGRPASAGVLSLRTGKFAAYAVTEDGNAGAAARAPHASGA